MCTPVDMKFRTNTLSLLSRLQCGTKEWEGLHPRLQYADVSRYNSLWTYFCLKELQGKHHLSTLGLRSPPPPPSTPADTEYFAERQRGFFHHHIAESKGRLLLLNIQFWIRRLGCNGVLFSLSTVCFLCRLLQDAKTFLSLLDQYIPEL